jgi:hypothetical protein
MLSTKPTGFRVVGGLTPQQYRLLKHVGLGYSRVETARVLGISPKTVDSHIENLKVAFNLDGGTMDHLLRLSVALGITTLSVNPAFASVLTKSTDDDKFIEIVRVRVSQLTGTPLTFSSSASKVRINS